MKKIFFLLVLSAIFYSTSCYASDNITVICNGKEIEFDVAPVIQNDRVLVPIRSIFEDMNISVTWDEENKCVVAIRNGEYCAFEIGSDILKSGICKDGEDDGELIETNSITIDSPAIQIDERILIPLRAVSEAMRAKVEWNNETSTCYITTTENDKFDDWIYYSSWSDTGKLYKIDTNGNNRKKLSDLDCYRIFYLDDWIYFNTWSNREVLYRVDTNGENQQQLTDGKIRIKAIKDNWIYYSVLIPTVEDLEYAKDGPLYKMHFDGSDKTLITDDIVRWTELIGDTIYYGSVIPDEEAYHKNYDLYKISINGENKQKVSSDTFKPALGSESKIKGNYLYTVNRADNFKIYRVNLSDFTTERLTDTYTLDYNVMDDHIIYRTNVDWSIHIVNLDGTNNKCIIEFKSHLNFNFEKSGKIYYHYSDNLDVPTQYWRCDLDGTNNEKLFEGSWVIDNSDNRIYYSRSYDFSGEAIWEGLYTVDYDGKNIICITDDTLSGFIEANNKVYTFTPKTSKLYKYDLDGSNKTLIINEMVKFLCFSTSENEYLKE